MKPCFCSHRPESLNHLSLPVRLVLHKPILPKWGTTGAIFISAKRTRFPRLKDITHPVELSMVPSSPDAWKEKIKLPSNASSPLRARVLAWHPQRSWWWSSRPLSSFRNEDVEWKFIRNTLTSSLRPRFKAGPGKRVSVSIMLQQLVTRMTWRHGKCRILIILIRLNQIFFFN